MRTVTLVTFCLFVSPILAQSQSPGIEEPGKVVCDETSVACSHRLLNGLTYKTLVTPEAVVTVSLADNGKYTRLEVGVTNTGKLQFDFLPTDCGVAVVLPKAKVLRMVAPEKIISSERHRAGWADALNSFGAGMASKPVTTQTDTSGTVRTTGSDGSYANGSYTGTSTSTTNVPDYAAQAQARAVILRRRAELDAHEAALERTVLKANTVEAGRFLGGFVFFESEKHGQRYVVDVLIRGVSYEFSIDRPKH